jgi:hypothetical protein
MHHYEVIAALFTLVNTGVLVAGWRMLVTKRKEIAETLSAQSKAVEALVANVSDTFKKDATSLKASFETIAKQTVDRATESAKIAEQHATTTQQHLSDIQELKAKCEATVEATLIKVKEHATRCEKAKQSAEHALLKAEHSENFAKIHATKAGAFLNAVEDKVKISF